ncbi:M56 family metallopeptidase [Acidicapsa acidisoli]|uniref:M56 family metallopeptidase n=1 Tax=Acidicapsa acidisoli TaxID=1615681 RepID=UPI0021E003E0|nr:M56 family metallopeptidase [Acidicapsa acidisoli]
MLTHAGFWILEAAFRSFLMAVAVWAGIRALRLNAVLAQKIAWVMVLLAAGTMPLLMHTSWLALDRIGVQALRIPIRPLRSASPQSVTQAAPQVVDSNSLQFVNSDSINPDPVVRIPKPSPSHRISRASHADEAKSISLHSVEQYSSVPMVVTETGPASLLVSPAPQRSTAFRKQETSSAGRLFQWAQSKLIVLILPILLPILASLYLAVAGLLFLRIVAGLAIAHRIWRSSQPVTDRVFGSLADPGALQLQARNIRSNPSLTTPVTIGSTVILPADYREWDAGKLRIVLAHEQSHVRQRDFYLQLLAAIHVAIFWFSPLGWWLQRKLSELGEALSDRAGLEQAPNAASYAKVLLEFAAIPRTVPIAGVAMARSSNVSSRIERILNARNFRLAFWGERRHAVLAAVIVPAALVVAIAGVRIVPAVEAAQAQTAASIQSATPVSGQVSGTAAGQITGQTSGEVAGQVTSVDSNQASDQAAPPAPPTAPASPTGVSVAPVPPTSDVAPMPAPEPAPHVNVQVNTDMAPEPPMPPQRPDDSSFAFSDDDDNSFAIIRGNGQVTMSGHAGRALEEAKRKYHSNFLWFERDGKSYVITDPAILAQAQNMLRTSPGLEGRKAELDRLQARLNEEMARMQPEIDRASRQNAEIESQMANLQGKLAKIQVDKIAEAAAKAFPPEEQEKLNREMAELAPELAKIKVPGPEFEAEMSKLHSQLAELQSDKFKKLTEDMSKEFSEEKLAELQERIGDIQGCIGEIQGRIGERQGELGEKQGEIGERMGRLGEEMGRIGEQQGRESEAASRRLRSVLDQAVRNGKAIPVD